MIYKALNDEDFDEIVMTFAEKLSKMPTIALGLTKKAVNSSYNNTMQQQLDLEENLQNERRNIKLLDPQYVQRFIEEYQTLMKESII